jgi:hypothetical protein
MNTVKYDRDITALLVIDPYNDFISEGGKVWDRLREVAEANNCIPHAIAILNAARNAQVRQRTRRVDGFARRGDCAVQGGLDGVPYLSLQVLLASILIRSR